jgi:nicotinamide riboside kinase
MRRPTQTVLITGPESSGKSTLARTLAWITDGIYVEEVARKYLHQRDGKYEESDLLHICRKQLDQQQLALEAGANYVFCDTGPEVIEVWSRVKYGRVDSRITKIREQQQYDLVILCSPDLPWEPDPLREAPDAESWWRLFEAYRQIIGPHRVIEGDFRIAQAIRALQLPS